MHSTDDLNDGYVGSGQRLWKSIKKYGKEQHRCEILEHLPDRASLAAREEQLITEEILLDPMCMNLRTGGTGNYPGTPTSEETRKKLSEASKRVVRTDEWKAKISAAHMGKKQDIEKSKRHSEKMKGRKATPEQIAARTAGQLSSEKFKKRYRAVMIDGAIYESGCHAVEALGIAGSTLHHRIKSPNWLTYQWADEAPKDPALVSSRARGPYGAIEII